MAGLLAWTCAAAGETNRVSAPAAARSGPRSLPAFYGDASFRWFVNQDTELEQYRYITEGIVDLEYELVRWRERNAALLDIYLQNGMGNSFLPHVPVSPVDLGYRLAPYFERRGRPLWRAGWDHGCFHLAYKDRPMPWYQTFGSNVAGNVFYNRAFAAAGSERLRRVDVWRGYFREGGRADPVWYIEAGAYVWGLPPVIPWYYMQKDHRWSWDVRGELRLPALRESWFVGYWGTQVHLMGDRAGETYWRVRVEGEALLDWGEYGFSVFAGCTPVDQHTRDSHEGLIDFGGRFFF